MRPDSKPIKEAINELNLIEDIVHRIIPMAARANVSTDMDFWVNLLAAAHSVGPLDLEELMTCQDAEFAKDVFGLRAMFCPNALRYYADWRPACYVLGTIH